MSGLSGGCHVPDNVKVNDCAGCRASCQGCHTFTNKIKNKDKYPIIVQRKFSEKVDNPDNVDKRQ